VKQFIGVDIGGANIKWSDGGDCAGSVPFPLWKQPQELAAALRGLLEELPAERNIVATMTGELADCFATKSEGVRSIVEAMSQAAPGRSLNWYTLDGTFVPSGIAIDNPLKVAAANWHALAKYAALAVEASTGLLIDIGSTTADIIPLAGGEPAPSGFTDTERLSTGELVYTGVERTPVCAIAPTVPWCGHNCRVAGELFATAWDIYLTLQRLPEEPDATHTADGRPATRSAAAGRLARSICADATECGPEDLQQIAESLADAQRNTLIDVASQVIERMAKRPQVAVVSGQGEFLAREVAQAVAPEAEILSLTERLGPVASRAAAAHALALIAMREGVDRCE